MLIRSRLAIGLVLLVGLRWAVVALSPTAFAPFTPHPLPQSAQGDFDGDGRADLALIQDGDDGREVSVHLSGSFGVTSLGTKVVSLIASDIDHDGDLDLVTVAPSGLVMAWLNDGRGRFTLQPASHPAALSAATTLTDAPQDESMALGATVPFVVPRTLNGTPVGGTFSRRPTVPLAFDLRVISLARLRAPPLSVSLA